MPENLSNEEKQDKLNSVIKAMDLHKCLHTGKIKTKGKYVYSRKINHPKVL